VAAKEKIKKILNFLPQSTHLPAGFSGLRSQYKLKKKFVAKKNLSKVFGQYKN